MANQPLAPANTSGEDEYEAFVIALSASARGRAFLAEHGRRQRLADTEMLLSALARLEAQLAPPPKEPDVTREDLAVLLDAIHAVQAEIDAANLATQVADLVDIVAALRTRIVHLTAAPAAQPPAAAIEAAAPQPAAAHAHAARAPVAADTGQSAPQPPGIPEVSWDDSLRSPDVARAEPTHDGPVAAGPPSTLAIAFVAELAERETAVSAKAEPEAPPEATVIKAGTMPPPAPFAGEDFSAAAAVKTVPKTDLLDSIMALSDDERTALFT